MAKDRVDRQKRAERLRAQANQKILQAIIEEARPGWTLHPDTSIPTDHLIDSFDELMIEIISPDRSRTSTIIVSHHRVIGEQG